MWRLPARSHSAAAPRAGLADAAAHHGGAVRAGRLGRRQRPHLGAAHRRNSRPAGGGREHRRRRRHDRIEPGREGRARWLSAADGHLGTNGVNQPLYKRPLYNAATDFAPVALVNQGLYVLLVRKDMPVVTLPEFIAYAKANQEKMHYGSGGAGSTTHMVCILLGMATGIEATHVPYRGAGPALQDLVGGRLDYMCEPLPTALPQIQGNTLKPIVLLAPTRTQILPDLPSAAEQGLKDFRSRAGTRCSCQRARRTRSSVGSTPRPARRSILPTSVPGLRRRAPKFPRWSAGRRSTSVSSSRARSSNGRRRSRPAAC